MSKTVVITGASRGIGAQCARAFAAASYNVVINYNKSEEQAGALVNELLAQGYSAAAIRADVSDSAQAAQLIDDSIQAPNFLD